MAAMGHRRSAAYHGGLPASASSASRDDVGVAADGLKYSKLARLGQAMNQVHYIEPTGEEQLPGS
jgi:hypothetical protein